jgi:hypothetical protein
MPMLSSVARQRPGEASDGLQRRIEFLRREWWGVDALLLARLYAFCGYKFHFVEGAGTCPYHGVLMP